MRVALITNHVNEVRRSMRRFAEHLESDLTALGVDVEVVAPKRSRLSTLLSPRAASLADKVRFQARLSGLTADIAHVIDQGDAGYVTSTGPLPTVVTCHDVCVLDDPQFLGPRFTSGWAYRGVLLARMRRGLSRARALVCDSDYTLRDVERLVPQKRIQERSRVYLPLRFAASDGAPGPLPAAVADLRRPYLLHVGSNGHRKNRLALLDVLDKLRPGFALVLAGEPPDAAFVAQANRLGFASEIRIVLGPSDAELGELYRGAHCLLFPSTFEGFGWPVLEAQSSRCPVVTTNVTSLPEVAGNGALFAAPSDTALLARHVSSLLDPAARQSLLKLGSENADRFRSIELGREYLRIYEKLLARRN